MKRLSGAFLKRLKAVKGYATEIVCRVGERYGKDMSDSRKAIGESIPNDHLAPGATAL